MLWVVYFGCALLLTLVILIPVWIKTALHLHHNYDLGIFSQALGSIRRGDLNPFLPALHLRLFADHFDPILVLAAPLGHAMEPAYAALLIEHVLVLLVPLPLLLACRRSPEHLPFACFAVVYLLFNRATLSAVQFPVHPTTWAAFFMISAGLLAKGRKGVLLVAASLLLMACKEEFPFAVLMLGGGLLWRRHRRSGAALALLALAWLVFALVIRPRLLGEVHDYSSRILTPFFQDPLGLLTERLGSPGKAKHLFRSLLPLIPAAVFLFRRKLPPDWTLLWMALPLLAIRFLDAAWQFHYLAPVVPLFLLFLWRDSPPRLPWKWALAGILITFASSSGPMGKGLAGYGRTLDLSGPRRQAIERGRALLLEQPGGKVLAGGNLTPLLARREEVYQIGGRQPSLRYRFLFTEKPPQGNPWPLTHADVAALIRHCRKARGWRVLLDDAHVFLAEYPADGPSMSGAFLPEK